MTSQAKVIVGAGVFVLLLWYLFFRKPKSALDSLLDEARANLDKIKSGANDGVL
jgi:hypothetical protein